MRRWCQVIAHGGRCPARGVSHSPPPPPHFCRDAVRSPQREGAKEGNAAAEVLWTGGGGALSAWAVTGTPSENLSQPAWPTCPHQGGCWGPRSSRPGGLWTECVHPEEAGASPPEAWAAAPRSSSQPSRASKLVPHPSAAAPCPDGPGRSPAAGWAASCRQQSLSLPRVTRTACSGASGEALCLQDKLPGVQDPLQSGHRLPFLPLRLPLSPPGPSFPSPMSRRQSCGLFSRLAACSPLRASPRALPSAQATFPRSLQPRGAGVS